MSELLPEYRDPTSPPSVEGPQGEVEVIVLWKPLRDLTVWLRHCFRMRFRRIPAENTGDAPQEE